MSQSEVTEEEIEDALKLSAQGNFSTSLALFQQMLTRAEDVNTRMKILLGIVTCSSWLDLDSVREDAIRELKHLPDYEASHTFVVMSLARKCADMGRVQEALNLINENLNTEVLQRHDLRDWKYENLFRKGRYLVLLARYDEAISALDAAHSIEPEGEFESDILIERSNCFLALNRYDDAFESASRVLSRGDQEMTTLAMQYMAESRMWQARVPEALELYVAILKRLPSRLVDEDRIRTGVKNAMAYLEKLRPNGKPS